MANDLGSPGLVSSAGRPIAPTLVQVAAEAGVSRSTASRAINGDARVSPGARSAVTRAVESLGYTGNPAARALVTGRTDSIALVVPEPDERVLSDPFFAGALRGLTTALAGTDLQIILLIAEPGDASQRSVRYLHNRHVDGAVVVSHHDDDAVNTAVIESGLPTVFIGRPVSARTAVHYVDTDNVEGGRIATEHLVARGRRRIGTIAGPANMSAGLDRLEGWRLALAAHGLADDAVEHGDFTSTGGAEAAARILDAHPDLDAIFVASDIMAAGALGVMASRAIAVPRDIAVVGYDDLGVAASTTPPLTTMTNPVLWMAQVAGELLLEQLTGEPTSGRPVILTPELVIRESS
jgi:DNA-binding LacI/PurR family transcriptional regulator